MLGMFPPALLVIAYYLIDLPSANPAPNNMALYMLLLVAIAEPSVIPLIHRMQISAHRTRKREPVTDGRFLTALSLIRYSFVSNVYVFGIIMYLLTRDISNMLYFYVIGAAWSLVHWPRRSHMSKFLKAVNAP
ncbi:MAG: hypothetical protein ACE5FH_00310 [Candidatus Zixiibacteriota bacterium]